MQLPNPESAIDPLSPCSDVLDCWQVGVVLTGIDNAGGNGRIYISGESGVRANEVFSRVNYWVAKAQLTPCLCRVFVKSGLNKEVGGVANWVCLCWQRVLIVEGRLWVCTEP